ncbi:hypothetical protein [Actinomadura algeriensis]|uniref:Lipoprotein n=1 Tax=Actinomadura algeriensis TaxID=1679523 RepID=A0ABR9JRM7_9ACTN|nr:hypothetical protein [Actinomadura algeriensis]MBE1533225.1 hypothetical protein [Actinomadura algeriensis]
MTGIGRWTVTRFCWFSVAGITLATAGCSTEQDAAALPSPTDSAQTVTPSSTAAVAQAYTDFVAMLDRADSLAPETRKQELSTVMVEPQLSRVLKRIDDMKGNNQATYGNIVVHTPRVNLTRNGAVVRDCQDSSNAGLLDTRTQKKLNRGVKERNIKALLEKGAEGRWRVSKFIVLGEGC